METGPIPFFCRMPQDDMAPLSGVSVSTQLPFLTLAVSPTR